MDRDVLLLAVTGVLVLVGQWISMRSLGSASVNRLAPRMRVRVLWWTRHTRWVTGTCALVVLGGVVARLAAVG